MNQIQGLGTNLARKQKIKISLESKLKIFENQISWNKEKIADCIEKMQKTCSTFNYKKEVELALSIMEKRKEIEEVKNTNPEFMKTINETIDELRARLNGLANQRRPQYNSLNMYPRLNLSGMKLQH